MGDKILPFETLRGLMALWVFFYHTASILLLHQPNQEFENLLLRLPSGTQAVKVFIILSGFVIFLVLANKQEGYFTYMHKRFFRIYPLFFITLTAATLLGPWLFQGFAPLWLQNQPSDTILNRSINAFYKPESYRAVCYFLQITMLSGLVPNVLMQGAAQALLSPTWSILLEWQFYLVAPILFAGMYGKPGHRGSLAAFLTIFAAWLFFRYYNPWGFGTAFLPVMFNYFLVGMFSYKLYAYLREKEFRIGWPLASVLLLLVATITKDPVFIVWTAFFLMIFFKCDNLLERGLVAVMSWRPLVYLGAISYSIYLWHLGLVYLIIYALGVVYAETPSLSPLFMLGWVMGIGTPLVLAMSALSYHFIEQPFIRLGSRLRRRAPSLEASEPTQSPTSSS
ncbi:MAG: acyltransferase [Verrucomicrobiota bacterium]